MAYASWLTPSTTSGSGNSSVGFTSASAHTGRSSRTTTANFRASGISDVPLTILQQAAAEYVAMEATKAVAQAGGTITISGESNSSQLTFSLGASPTLVLTLPSTYTAGGEITTNGVAISGDPGTAAKYAFSIQFANIPANTSVSDLLAQLTVTANGGQTAVCAITQAADEPSLSINPTSIELTAAGIPAVTVTVTSNTSWTIV